MKPCAVELLTASCRQTCLSSPTRVLSRASRACFLSWRAAILSACSLLSWQPWTSIQHSTCNTSSEILNSSLNVCSLYCTHPMKLLNWLYWQVTPELLYTHSAALLIKAITNIWVNPILWHYLKDTYNQWQTQEVYWQQGSMAEQTMNSDKYKEVKNLIQDKSNASVAAKCRNNCKKKKKLVTKKKSQTVWMPSWTSDLY